MTASLVEAQRQLLLADLEERVRFVSDGFQYQEPPTWQRCGPASLPLPVRATLG